MNWVDVGILSILGVSIVVGFFRGAIKSVFSFIGVVVGFIVATRESGAVGMVLAKWMPDNVAAVAGFVFVFLGIAIVFGLIGWLLRELMVKIFLGWFDRTLGAILGFVRAAVLLGVMALVVESLGAVPETRKAVTYPFALLSGKLLLKMIPEETLERLRWEKLVDKLRSFDATDVI